MTVLACISADITIQARVRSLAVGYLYKIRNIYMSKNNLCFQSQTGYSDSFLFSRCTFYSFFLFVGTPKVRIIFELTEFFKNFILVCLYHCLAGVDFYPVVGVAGVLFRRLLIILQA